MKKDFDGWNNIKQELHGATDTPFCNEREVWWCSLGLNIGFEQDGSGEDYRRPVLIFKHMGGQTYLVVPLTISPKTHPMRLPIGVVGGRSAYTALSQIRVIDTRRLLQKIETLSETVFDEIRKTIKDFL